MLHELFKRESIATKILSKEEFKPYPKVGDRKDWEKIHEDAKKYIIIDGEKYLKFEWPSLPATRYMEYSNNGNRSNYQGEYFKRRGALGALTMAECVEGKGRFLEDIVNGIWCICEESSWVVSAHNNDMFGGKITNILPDVSKPYIDIFCSETASLLTWTYYFLKESLDRMSPLICQRICLEMKNRIFDPYLSNDDFSWMGLLPGSKRVNNHNSWCNSNILMAFLILEDSPNKRVLGVEKCMKSLDSYIESYSKDGGSDEGTHYWDRGAGKLFDGLEALYQATKGKINVYDQELIRDIGRFIYRSHISNDYFVDFADGDARLNIGAELIYRYGKRIDDENLCSMGIDAFHRQSSKIHIDHFYPMHRVINILVHYDELENKKVKAPFFQDVWLDEIEVMAAREYQGSDSGLYLAAKGGHNGEHHNHNDVGHFIVYCDGKPVIIDPGVETYTAKTFSPQRYDIWTMQSAYHNLPTINGIQQKDGSKFKAEKVLYRVNPSLAELSLDLTHAYPREAGIVQWTRNFRLNREKKSVIEIIDDFMLDKTTEDITWTFMTSCSTDINTPGRILFITDAGMVEGEYDSDWLESLETQTININDSKMGKSWGNRIYRILIKTKKAVNSGKFTFRFSKA